MFQTEKFITEVEKRPALYNMKLKEYSNRDIKAELWEEVAQEMYTDWHLIGPEEKYKRGKELQIKWKSIRDHFKKEVKLEKQIQRGQATKGKKRYIYYDQLGFLLNHIEDRPATSNFDEEEMYPQMPIEGSIVDLSDSKPPRKRGTKRSYKDTFDNDIMKMLNETVPPLPRQEIEVDPMGNRAFLMSLLPMMNIMHPKEVIHLRFKIMELFNMFRFPSTAPTFTNQFANPL